MKKLNDEVKISGELLTAMFNTLRMKCTFNEVFGIVTEFNKQMEDQMDELSEEDIKKQMEDQMDELSEEDIKKQRHQKKRRMKMNLTKSNEEIIQNRKG